MIDLSILADYSAYENQVCRYEPEKILWGCKQVVDCRSVDWRYYDPIDACTYKNTIEKSEENPSNNPSYGSHCVPITSK